MSYYTEEEVSQLGLRSVGSNVLISRDARLYRPESICIGSNVKIDDFCVLCGDIQIGNYVHLSVGVNLLEKVRILNHVSISFHCCLIGKTDDFNGDYLHGPMVPDKFRNVEVKEIFLKSYTSVGANSTILLGSCLNEGTFIGANSLVSAYMQTDPWSVYAGTPVRFLRKRSKECKKLSFHL